MEIHRCRRLATRRGHRAIPAALGIATVAGVLQEAVGAELLPLLTVGGGAFLLFACTTSFVLWRVLRSERVTGDTLCGAIAVYLLIGGGGPDQTAQAAGRAREGRRMSGDAAG